MRATCLAVLAIGLAATSPRLARADAPSAEAQALFESARALMVEGSFAEACGKLERSEALDPGIGTEFNLARCWDLSGRLASAYAAYERVIAATHAAGQTSREALTRELAAALEPRLARVRLLVSSGGTDPGFELTLDGAPLDRARWSTTLALDPGTHVVTAAAPASKSWRREFAIQREGELVTIEVPTLMPLAALTMTPTSELPPPRGEESSGRGRTQRTAAIALAALGLGGAGVGGYYGIRAWSFASQAAPSCRGSVCDPTGVSLRRESIADGSVSTASFAIGAVLLVTGAVLWFTAPSHSAPLRGHSPSFQSAANATPGVPFP